jgi:hypothetical protein
MYDKTIQVVINEHQKRRIQTRIKHLESLKVICIKDRGMNTLKGFELEQKQTAYEDELVKLKRKYEEE